MAQRQPSRKALYIPFVLLAILAVAWSLGWFWLRGETRARMDAGVAELRAQGYTVSWRDRTLGGFPFRMDVNLTDFHIAEPSGWGVRAPQIRSEAYAYALDHWVAVAPKGVVLDRPIGGPLVIKGEALRASLTGLDRTPPRVAVEGANLTFTPTAGGQPFLLRSAGRLVLHLRPGPQDQGAILMRVEDAKANLPGLLARVADDDPVEMNVELIFNKASALQGQNWRTMASRWSSAGGTVTVQNASLKVGGAVLAAHGGALSIGPDGRAEGGLDLDLAKAGDTLSDLSGGMIPPGYGFGGLSLRFSGGQTLLGPLPIAPAPRVY
ncbi:MAG TPA: DUF2125 domain-containing protein [Caulobacteraceae bacterium]